MFTPSLGRPADGAGEDDGIDFASRNENGRHRKARNGQPKDRSGTQQSGKANSSAETELVASEPTRSRIAADNLLKMV